MPEVPGCGFMPLPVIHENCEVSKEEQRVRFFNAGMTVIMGLIPFVLSLIAAFLILLRYPITEETPEKMRVGLREK